MASRMACHPEKWRRGKVSPCEEAIANTPLLDIAWSTLAFIRNERVVGDVSPPPIRNFARSRRGFNGDDIAESISQQPLVKSDGLQNSLMLTALKRFVTAAPSLS